MTKRFTLIFLIILGLCGVAKANVPVQIGPDAKSQFFDQNGAPLSGGIVCTYISGTNTPLATYSDPLGTVPNQNPVVLDSAGRALIYYQTTAYRIVLAGGGPCGSPSNLQWTVDGFNVGVTLAGNNTWTGTNIFSGTLNVTGTFNASNGGSLNGSFSGNPTFSGSPVFTGILGASQFQSTVSTGTPPLIVASTTTVPNLSVAIVNGVNYPSTGSAAGGSVPMITSLNSAAFVPFPGCLDIGGNHLNFDAAAFVFSCGTSIASLPQVIQTSSVTTMAMDIALPASTPTTLVSKTITVPSSGGPWRVLTSYNLYFVNSGFAGTVDAWVSDGSVTYAGSQASAYYTGAGPFISGVNSSQLSTLAYANGTTVTFTLVGEADQNMTAKQAAFNGGGPLSGLSLSVVSSN